MKTSLFTAFAVIPTLFLGSCKQPPKAEEPHKNCLALKQPVEGQIYGVSQVWSEKGQRYALAVDLAEAEQITGGGERTTTFKYKQETRGVMKVEGHVPTSDEEKIHFLKLVNGRWTFTK